MTLGTDLFACTADNDKVRTHITLANFIYGLGASDFTRATHTGHVAASTTRSTRFSIFAAPDRSAIFHLIIVKCDTVRGSCVKKLLCQILPKSLKH